ncbi:MAG: MFS transporter [Gammaproteobacteria bacterium]|nr:MFS transporter [Gammaproteobacteria bacterium]
MPTAAQHPGVSTQRGKAILVAGMIGDRIGLSLLFIVFGPLARDVGLSDTQFGLLMAASNVTLGIASPFWGRKSQVLGRKPVFMIGLFGYAVGYSLLAIFIQAGLDGWLSASPVFWCLLATRFGYGVIAAATQPAATAYIADITSIAGRAKGMALIGIAAGVGTVLGPLIGSALSGAKSVLPLYVIAGIMVSAAILAWAGLTEPSRHLTRAVTRKLSFLDSRVFPYLLGWCIAIYVLTSIQTITAFYIADNFAIGDRDAVTRATSVAFLCMGAALLFVQGVILQMFRISPKILLRAGFILFGMGLVVLAATSSLAMLNLSYMLFGVGFSAITPGLNAGASISVEPEEQGAVAGLLSAAPVVGMIFGPVVGTLLYGVNATSPIWLGAGLSLAMAAYFFVQPRAKKVPE